MVSSPLKMSNDARKVDAIIEVIEKEDLTKYEAWSDLDALSTHTEIDEVEVDPAGVIVEDNKFEGLLNIYVGLQYGGNRDEGFSTSDSFEGEFKGHFEDDKPVIDSIRIDTSAFYK